MSDSPGDPEGGRGRPDQTPPRGRRVPPDPGAASGSARAERAERPARANTEGGTPARSPVRRAPARPVSAFAARAPLETPLEFIKGVGPQRAPLLERLGLLTVGDLLFYLPRDVLNLATVTPVADLQEDVLQTVEGEVVDRDSRVLRGGRTMTAVVLRSGNDFVRGVWFNQPYMLQRFSEGERVLFSGKPKYKQRRWEFSHPHVQSLGDEDEAHGGIWPRYRLTDGLRQSELRRIVGHALEGYLPYIVDRLPEAYRQQVGWPHLSEAVRHVHRPPSVEQYEAARQRLIYDDLLEFEVALALRRRAWKSDLKAPALPRNDKVDARIRRLFGFELTAGQNAAIEEICADLARDEPMHRLLQADVGAGKTAVAIYAILVAVAQGWQTVLMAPTEILAQQHAETLDRLLAQSRVERGLLTGQLSAADRRDLLSRLASGRLQVLVGTQAAIQQDVSFGKLGLVIIDEQHKFGVRQRAHFSSGQFRPHVLVMTATPIPRSLCLTQFGDLDISTISDLPPGRQPVVTTLLAGPEAQANAWNFLLDRLREGRQMYVVCPRIDQEGVSTARSAEAVYNELRRGALQDFTVGLVHGRLPRDERQATMDQFRAGDLQVLVSTTVIEVGVDVPAATLMVIYDAERYGLAQLHQLRGRVGRGRRQGYCFLVTDNLADDVQSRLEAVVNSSNGFEIADLDFELRGPGDVLGTRQHGELPLRVADLVRDRDMLVRARGDAFGLVATGEFDEPAFAMLKVQVMERFADLMQLPKTG